MTLDINKTEYIAILAGIDCLPQVKEGEVIAPAFVELAQKTAIEHFTHRFPDLFRVSPKTQLQVYPLKRIIS